MPTVCNQVVLEWRDKNGESATTFWTSQDQESGPASTYAPLAAAAQAISVAAVVAIQFQSTIHLDATPVEGAYQSVKDRGVLLGKYETTGKTQQFGIPAPAEEILQADHELIDMSNPLVVAFAEAAVAVLGDANNHALAYFKRGWRGRARGVW